MIRELTVTATQAKGLVDRLRIQSEAIAAAGHYLSAICDQHGIAGASLVTVDGTTVTVSTPDDGPVS